MTRSHFTRPNPRLAAGVALLALIGAAPLAGCSSETAAQDAPPAGPPQVGYVVVAEQPVTLTTELPGRTAAFETSEVRPQVNGLVTARLFEEGSYVQAGQPLYRIDAAPYQALVASSQAALGRAQAGVGSADALARRYGELVSLNAIAKQEYENAVTTANQVRADVTVQQAALRSARIDLGRTTITAPISGVIGAAASTTGALVSAAQTTPLTTIQRLDPIHVDMSQSSADVLRLRQQIMAGQMSRDSGTARVRLRLEDGSVYPIEGRLKFTDVTVDPATGSQTIRAVFPNPSRLLLPGMFVRAELVEGTRSNALLVPQRAVSRDERGRPTVLVVTPNNKIALRVLTAPSSQGDSWIVTAGLKPGERVVVEGAQRLRSGMAVAPRPWVAGQSRAATAAAPAGGGN